MDFIKTLTRLGGYYECPKNGRERLGPLAGYAGRYRDTDDGTLKQYVGDVYANCAVLEKNPRELVFFTDYLAEQLSKKYVRNPPRELVMCGLPMGGIATGMLVATKMGVRFAYPEKKVLEAATASSRERSQLAFGRHAITSGDHVVLAEDVLNNFSTVGEAIDLVEHAGGKVEGIIGLLNRSPFYEAQFSYKGEDYPIICVTRKEIIEYEQNHLAVARDVANGNVCWKPKDEWPRLQKIMEVVGK